MRADRILFESAGPDIVESLAAEDVEVIEPERGHHFLQLTRTFNRADHPRLDRFAQNYAGLDARILGRVFCRVLVGTAVCLEVFLLGVFLRHHDWQLILDEQRDRRHVQGAIRADALDQVVGNRNGLGI